MTVRRASMARAARLAIVALWVGLVGMLIRQQLTASKPSEPAPTGTVEAEGEQWMSVHQGAQKIGYAHLAVHRNGEGFRVGEESLLRLNVMENVQMVRTIVDADVGADFSLARLRFELVNGPAVFRAEGQRDGSTFHLRTTVGDQESVVELPVKGPLHLPSTARRLLTRESLVAGRRYEATVFDPALLSERTVVTAVIGEELVPGLRPPRRGWRIEETYGGMTSKAWLDEEGEVLREEGPMGLVLVRATEAEATGGDWTDADALDLVASVAVPLRAPIDDARERLRLRMRVGGIDLKMIPVEERQRLEGDIVTMRRETPPESVAYALPYAAEGHGAELSSTPLLQSDHPRVRSLAETVLHGERRPVAAAHLLRRYVYDTLRKIPTVSIPNALQVIDSGAGDCNEHAVLFAALARAAGLPTRVVAGVVYLDGAFYYHAWNEVWLDQWISVDPVMNQMPADVTHVAFVTGNPEDHLAMIGVIGRLTLEVVREDIDFTS